MTPRPRQPHSGISQGETVDHNVDPVNAVARALCATHTLRVLALAGTASACPHGQAAERQITSDPAGHILANTGVWSPDGQWIVFDRRIREETFDGARIERAHASSGMIQTLYTSTNGAACGVPTCSPVDDRVVFILGPEHPTPEWSYRACHRRGVIVSASRPGDGIPLDARDLTPPFTPGALRGGTHLHAFSGDGQWVVSTYEDHLLALNTDPARGDLNQRNLAVSIPAGPVRVGRDHPRNHDGDFFTVVVTRTVNRPRPGSAEIARASEEAWIGTHGYLRTDGARQKRALAFQGLVKTPAGRDIAEVFVADLPDNLTLPGDAGSLAGTATRRPAAPAGVAQRRLTFTADRRHPGLQGPRHWLRSSPDGSRIALLMKDDAGIVQVWTVCPTGGPPLQVTRGDSGVTSAFSWRADGRSIAFARDRSIFVADIGSGRERRLTPRAPEGRGPTPHACVFSPDGRRIAYMKPVECPQGIFDQIFIAEVEDG